MPARCAVCFALILACAKGSASADSAAPRGSYSGATETVYPAWFKSSFLDLAEDVADAAAADRNLVVLFHQHGCPYCNALVERNLSQRQIEDSLRRDFDVVALNLWGDREVVSVAGQQYSEKEFGRALGVQFTPTLLFFDAHGDIVLRLNGYLPPSRFMAALAYVADEHYRRTNFPDYVARHASPGAVGELISQPFFQAPPYDLSRLRRPLAVFFEQRQCPNCEQLHSGPLRDAETRRLLQELAAVQLDMWSDTPVTTPAGRAITARVWARELGIHYAPSIVLFAADGSEVIRSEAFFKSFHTQSLFDYVASGDYRSEPSFQRYLSARAERLRAAGQDVDIWR